MKSGDINSINDYIDHLSDVADDMQVWSTVEALRVMKDDYSSIRWAQVIYYYNEMKAVNSIYFNSKYAIIKPKIILRKLNINSILE
jgi:hypothetical protein